MAEDEALKGIATALAAMQKSIDQLADMVGVYALQNSGDPSASKAALDVLKKRFGQFQQ